MTTRRHVTGDRGSAAVLIVGLVPMLLAVASLVWDGGNALTLRTQAADTAEAAARAGADLLDVDAARRGLDRIDIPAATRRACSLVRAELPGATCSAHATAVTVTVTLTAHAPTVMLGLVGIHAVTTHAQATATPLRGVRTADPRPGARP